MRRILPAGLLIIAAGMTEAAAQPLPPGPGQQTVQQVCSVCHDLTRVVDGGRSRTSWETTLHMMVNAGAPLPADQFATTLDYLATHFPERPAPPAKVIAGPVAITIAEWVVPTPGARPHDPLAARDGSLWYTGQMANQLGRLDPKTGQFRLFPTGAALAGPHGLVEDAKGAIWFTANFSAAIGRLDPADGRLTRYPLPDPSARDPHTPIFDHDGILWFTVQNGNRIGRLDPTTGAIRLIAVPTPNARPYGLAIDPAGVPYFVEFGTNKLARIDPKTLVIHEFPLPDPESRPRRLAIGADGVIWYTDFARGMLGRFDPKTGDVTEFASPSGPRAEPYGITIAKGAIWYSESATRPNTLVRFDPERAQFQSFEILPSGGGVVRNMMATPAGDLVLAESGVNRIALVQVK